MTIEDLAETSFALEAADQAAGGSICRWVEKFSGLTERGAQLSWLTVRVHNAVKEVEPHAQLARWLMDREKADQLVAETCVLAGLMIALDHLPQIAE